MNPVIRQQKKVQAEEKRAQKHRVLARFYNLNSMLGNDWAIFYLLIGGRMTGKSYSVSEYLCKHWKHSKIYWMRISDTSTKALLMNKADKLVDPDLKRKYNLELTTKGFEVFNRGELFATVVPLTAFGKLKGVGFYDKDYDGDYILVLDEFQLEEGERRTPFDILYNFIGMCENVARTTKKNIKVFLMGNTLQEACTVLKAFNFIPEKFGRFYLKSKRAIIDNLEPTEEYIKDRKGSIADILGGDQMSNYTNALIKDLSSIDKTRTKRPTGIIKFSKYKSDWFTLWDGKIIKKYNDEKMDPMTDFAMRPYLDTFYSKERAMAIIQMYDARSLKYNTLITQSYFNEALARVRQTR